MRKALSIFTLATVLLFTVSAIAQTKVVVIPLGGKKTAGDAVASDVFEGKTFSNKDNVGITGNMTNNGVMTFNPGTFDQNIPKGYHNGSGTVQGDSNLVSGNIRSGASIFGLNGTSIEASGTALPSQVLFGQTFSNDSGLSTGIMVNVGKQYIYPFTFNQTITQGYHDGTGSVAGDTNLVSGNIKAGAIIFGVGGDTNVVDTSDGDAVASEILDGKVAYAKGAKISGSILTQSLSSSAANVSEGFYHTTSLDVVDPDLSVSNIKSGVSIFGIVGTVLATDFAEVGITGQETLCLDRATGITVDCSTTTGQDSNLQKGVPWTVPRFTNNNDGTVTDNLTGLIWLKDANCIKSSNPLFDQWGTVGDGIVNWGLGLDFIDGINNGIYDCEDISNNSSHQTDWRMPNIKELHSLVSYQYYSPCLTNATGTGQWTEGDIFNNIELAKSYFSSTVGPEMTGHVMVFRFYSCETVRGGPGEGFIWAVRGGI